MCAKCVTHAITWQRDVPQQCRKKQGKCAKRVRFGSRLDTKKHSLSHISVIFNSLLCSLPTFIDFIKFKQFSYAVCFHVFGQFWCLFLYALSFSCKNWIVRDIAFAEAQSVIRTARRAQQGFLQAICIWANNQSIISNFTIIFTQPDRVFFIKKKGS